MLLDEILFKSQALLDRLEIDEGAGGGLVSRDTLRAAGELRRSVLLIVARLSDADLQVPTLVPDDRELML